MAAPLYSRFCRKFDRDVVKVYAKRNPAILKHFREFKTKRCRVYSLTDRASYEFGAYSAQSPKDHLEALDLYSLPTETVWVEFNWHMAMEAIYEHGNFPVSRPLDDTALRIGMLIKPLTDPQISWGAAMYYLSTNGATILSPLMVHVGKVPIYEDGGRLDQTTVRSGGVIPGLTKEQKKDGRSVQDFALGPAYMDANAKDQPRLVKRLRDRCTFAMLTLTKDAIEKRHDIHQAMLQEANGSARLLMAALGVVAFARATRYVPDPDAEPRETDAPERPRYDPIEVDVFLSPNARPGRTILKGVRASGTRLHDVGGHWAYRHPKDGSDPLVCRYGGHHDFEAIPDTKREECVRCGQLRWWKDAHERGDAALGRAPRKVYRVRGNPDGKQAGAEGQEPRNGDAGEHRTEEATGGTESCDLESTG